MLPDPTPNVIDSVNALIPESEKEERKLNDVLRGLGCTCPLSLLSSADKIFLARTCDEKAVPLERDLFNFFAALKKLDSFHWVLPYYSKWIAAAEKGNTFHAALRMQFTYLLRHSGRFKEAISVSNVVEFERFRFPCSPSLLAVLCTIRAAVFLDIYELHRDKELLRVSRITLNKSWANKKSPEASLVYKRLETFERGIEKDDYRAKVNAAYVEWASW